MSRRWPARACRWPRWGAMSRCCAGTASAPAAGARSAQIDYPFSFCQSGSSLRLSPSSWSAGARPWFGSAGPASPDHNVHAGGPLPAEGGHDSVRISAVSLSAREVPDVLVLWDLQAGPARLGAQESRVTEESRRRRRAFRCIWKVAGSVLQ